MITLTKENFVKMINAAAVKIDAENNALSTLDAATGDGDHGVAIKKTLDAMRDAANKYANESFTTILQQLAMCAMSSDGGSTSSLYGTFFMGMAMTNPSDELSVNEATFLFEAGLSNMGTITKATLGDKTMMDALIPAIKAFVAKATETNDIALAMAEAAKAAKEGAEKTKEYSAKIGRARTMGDKAIGHIDAGAVSVSYIFAEFAAALA